MRLHNVIDIPEWTDLAPSRHNQVYRNQMADQLILMADRIRNCQQNEGVTWRLEPSIAKPVEVEEIDEPVPADEADAA